MNDNPPPQHPGAPRQPINPVGTSVPPPPPPGYVPAVYVQQPSGSRALGKIMLYVLGIALLVSIVINVYLSKYGPVAMFIRALGAGGVQEVEYNPQIQPTGDTERIVVVRIAGMIDDPTAEYARQTFSQLEQDPPAAVILRVESGGGGVTASDQIWHAIQKFRAKHPKVPFIASFGIAAASGGYYISAPADYIFAERTTLTGSIGVYAQIPSAGGLIEKMGVEMNMVIADKSPYKDDANNLFVEWYDKDGKLTPDGEAAVDVVKNMVNLSYDTFLDVVVTGRTAANTNITKADMEQAAKGQIFIGQEAVQAKLVDEIGYLDDAIAYAAKQANLSGTPRVRVISEPVPGMISSLLSKRDGVDMTNVTGDELRELVDDTLSVRLEYRMRLR